MVGQLGCNTARGSPAPPDGAQPLGHLLSELLMSVKSGKEDSSILGNSSRVKKQVKRVDGFLSPSDWTESAILSWDLLIEERKLYSAVFGKSGKHFVPS